MEERMIPPIGFLVAIGGGILISISLLAFSRLKPNRASQLLPLWDRVKIYFFPSDLGMYLSSNLQYIFRVIAVVHSDTLFIAVSDPKTRYRQVFRAFCLREGIQIRQGIWWAGSNVCRQVSDGRLRFTNIQANGDDARLCLQTLEIGQDVLSYLQHMAMSTHR